MSPLETISTGDWALVSRNGDRFAGVLLWENDQLSDAYYNRTYKKYSVPAMSTADALYELVKTLPEEQANLVLMFAKFLRQQLQSSVGDKSDLLSSYLGALDDSPNFNEDPVEIQRAMRREWD